MTFITYIRLFISAELYFDGKVGTFSYYIYGVYHTNIIVCDDYY